MRTVFGPEWLEWRGNWLEFHSEQLHDLYCSPNFNRVSKSRKTTLAGYVERCWEKLWAFKIRVGKPEGIWQLGSPSLGIECNEKCLKCGLRNSVLDTSGSGWGKYQAAVNMVMNLGFDKIRQIFGVYMRLALFTELTSIIIIDYGEVLGDKNTMYIRVTLYWG